MKTKLSARLERIETMVRGYYWVDCNNWHFIHFWTGDDWDRRYLKDYPHLLERADKYPPKAITLVKEVF